ncbi:hypothetical protein N7493_012007 [Penicillium malachiteum]|uniref:FAR1 domain-containing protein n=1 Tax=Penicillium malachiteum TaxID=1324776 RepID=A0AAD6MQ04_9EURO|nr:hypothetical protein N7493_012007 [Penicillium malachiteum]
MIIVNGAPPVPLVEAPKNPQATAPETPPETPTNNPTTEDPTEDSTDTPTEEPIEEPTEDTIEAGDATEDPENDPEDDLADEPTDTTSDIYKLPVLPAGKLWPSWEAGLAEINTFARGEGYAVVKARSKPSKKGELRLISLRCDRGGKYEGQPRSRNTSTRALRCPFAVSLRRQLPSKDWLLVHANVTHNHEPSPPSTHPVHRRADLRAHQAEIDRYLRLTPLTTQQILLLLKDANPDICLQARDIYNRRRELKVAGRIP